MNTVFNEGVTAERIAPRRWQPLGLWAVCFGECAMPPAAAGRSMGLCR